MMFLEITRTHWVKFRRDRAAFVMAFIVPIVFFSIFATLLGGSGNKGPITVAIVDEDGGAAAQTFVAKLRHEKMLNVLDRAIDADGHRTRPMTAARAEHEIRTGDLSLALVLPKGFTTNVTLLADTSDPYSSRVVSTLLQKVVLGQMPLDVETRDLLGASKRNPRIAFAAAGLGVMFLLFMATSSAGTLLDEADSGTMDRILSSNVSMTQLLLGKLTYMMSIATVQLTVTFTWGALVFGVELWEHLGAFLLMTVVTSFATGSFGLMLASIARTRAQLSAFSNLLVLVMSALGGSLFPRFLMPAGLKKLGLLTINGWALDGYLKVFWREEPITALWPQLLALTIGATVLFTTARFFARRWEAA